MFVNLRNSTSGKTAKIRFIACFHWMICIYSANCIVEILSIPCKTNFPFMKLPICNDQGYIAESFSLAESYTQQTARLAFFKINSYKLSLIKANFSRTKVELEANIRGSLMNYTRPEIILADLGFFGSETDN